MTTIVFVGGPYHGRRELQTSDFKGTRALTGPDGDQRYVPFESRGEYVFYRHDSVGYREAIKLAGETIRAR